MPWWTASAQGRSDVRWRLLDRDTIAEVLYSTMLDWATYRTVDRQLRREIAVRLVAAEGLVRSQRHELDVTRTAMQAQATDIAALRSSLTDSMLSGAKCCTKADRLKVWATVGKVGVVVVGVSVLGTVAVAILDAAR